MIGNDVIDLALAQKESNWKRSRFLDKIFTEKEQGLILNSLNPEVTVWNLWSRKEAAYKIHNRQTQLMSYIPLKLECFDLETADGNVFGKVICGNEVYLTKTTINSDCIETIAVIESSDFDNVCYLDSTASIVKTNGIPNYYDFEYQILKPVSKSHHGRFEKIVCLNS